MTSPFVLHCVNELSFVLFHQLTMTIVPPRRQGRIERVRRLLLHSGVALVQLAGRRSVKVARVAVVVVHRVIVRVVLIVGVRVLLEEGGDRGQLLL